MTNRLLRLRLTERKSAGVKTVFTAAVLLSLYACGGGGSTSSTTPAEADTVAPTLANTIPVDSAADVALGADITAVFSEGLAPATVNADTFAVSTLSAGALAGAVSFDEPTLTATFSPETDLPAGETIQVTLTSGITDVAGNALAEETFSFMTVAGEASGTVGVMSRSPDIDAENVLITESVEVVFTEDLDAATVDDTSFTLTGDAPVSGVVSYDSAALAATFTPDRCLPSGTMLSVDLADSITATDGATFDGETYSFTTVDGWTDEQQVDDPVFLDASGLRLASNGVDLAATLRLQDRDGDGTNDLVANVYDVNGCAWGPAVVLDNAPTAGRITMLEGATVNNNAGGFLATWEQSDDVLFSVYDPNTLEWADPAPIEATPDTTATISTLAVSSTGDALSVWYETELATGGGGGGGMGGMGGGGGAAGIELRASMYDGATSTWSTPQTITSNITDSTAIGDIVAGLDALGNAVVIFEQDIEDEDLDGDDDPATGVIGNDVVVSIFSTVVSAWSPPLAIDELAENADGIFVDVNDSGGAIAVWEQDDVDADTNDSARGVVFAIGSPIANMIETFELPAFTGAINDLTAVIDNDGNAAAVWVQAPGDGTALSSTALAVTFDPAVGFGAVQEIGTNSATASVDAEFEGVEFDANGNPIAYWSLVDSNTGTTDIQVSTFDGTAWGAPVDLVTDETGESTNLELASGTGIGDFLIRLRDDSEAGNDDDVRSIINRDNATVETALP